MLHLPFNYDKVCFTLNVYLWLGHHLVLLVAVGHDLFMEMIL